MVETATDAVVLNFEVQTFLYGEGNQKYPVQYATFWTTLGRLEPNCATSPALILVWRLGLPPGL